jgi:hypothetical protein
LPPARSSEVATGSLTRGRGGNLRNLRQQKELDQTE